jgi:hypothetical protein
MHAHRCGTLIPHRFTNIKILTNTFYAGTKCSEKHTKQKWLNEPKKTQFFFFPDISTRPSGVRSETRRRTLAVLGSHNGATALKRTALNTSVRTTHKLQLHTAMPQFTQLHPLSTSFSNVSVNFPTASLNHKRRSRQLFSDRHYSTHPV